MKIFKNIIFFIFIIFLSFYAIAEEVDSLTDLKNEFNNLKEQLNENIVNLSLPETEAEKAFDQSIQALLSDIENITNVNNNGIIIIKYKLLNSLAILIYNIYYKMFYKKI